MNGLKAPMNWGMPAPALPADFASMGTYGAMPAVDYGLNYSGGTSGTGFTAGNASLPALNLSGSIPSGGSNWFRDSGFLGQKNADGTMTQGWGGMALGGAQALGSLYMGMQQYNLAKDTLANNKAQFERNFAAQKATTNASLEDRQRARVASNAGAYQSVGDYMNQNGVR